MASIKQQAIDNKVDDRVRFLGYRSDVGELMSKAKSVIMSSPFEGFGFVTVEAMYNGAIVIGRDNAGTKEQFDNGLSFSGREIGLRYSTTNELIRLMIEVDTKGKAYYRDMLISAQEVVCSHYGISHHNEQILNIYKNVINR